MDAVALAYCLDEHYQPTNDLNEDIQTTKRDLLHRSVASYSQKAVPQGYALYDLSFGNDGKTLPIFRNARAFIQRNRCYIRRAFRYRREAAANTTGVIVNDVY